MWTSSLLFEVLAANHAVSSLLVRLYIHACVQTLRISLSLAINFLLIKRNIKNVIVYYSSIGRFEGLVKWAIGNPSRLVMFD
jgi:hypothetical protein